MYFDWDDANILHLARHDITPEEAERVIKNHPVDLIVQHVNGEWRLQQAGETNAGRILTILSTERDNKSRVISGWDSQKREKNIYFKHRVNQVWKPN
jgi:uncharacterized DUF497 family protein